MTRRARTLRELAQVRADNRTRLTALLGSRGSALGRRNFDGSGAAAGDPSILVFVPHKVHASLLAADLMVPPVLTSADGTLEAPTDVVATTVEVSPDTGATLDAENRSLVNLLRWADGRLDYLPPGAQVRGAKAMPGGRWGPVASIGFAVRSTRRGSSATGFLTDGRMGSGGESPLYIPGAGHHAIRVGTVRAHESSDGHPDSAPELDSSGRSYGGGPAFAVAEDRVAPLLRNRIPGVGDVRDPYHVDLDTLDVIGLPVKKVGRTTGLTRGTVVAYGYEIADEPDLSRLCCGEATSLLHSDFLIAPAGGQGPFAADGDAGSAILVDGTGVHRDEALAVLAAEAPLSGATGPDRDTPALAQADDLRTLLDDRDLTLL